MATKLNPPIIEGKIRAQQKDILYIPFQMNRTVGGADYKGINMIIKSATTNKEIGSLYCNKGNIYFKNNEYWAPFERGTIKFEIGQYYKIQLAYVSGDTTTDTILSTDIVGFYSSSAIFKYTDINNIEIVGLKNTGSNVHSYVYTGKVDLSSDRSEKIYSYKFEIKDISGRIVAESGEQLHNSSNDTNTNYQTDEWSTRYALQSGKPYTIKYSVRTINNLELSSAEYVIQAIEYIDSELFKYYNFIALNKNESGCVELSIQPKENNVDPIPINGLFLLLRSSSEDNFNSWYQMTNFVLASWNSNESKFLCKDYSVSQGITYKYGIQAYNNNGVYSTIVTTDPIYVDFEDMFLSDGERQLRIKYNPKVSSFKNTILESKMDTLGGKYPFFFRNGNVNYKEFAISGLISMQMDENGEFAAGLEIVEPRRRATQELEQFKDSSKFVNDPWTYTDNYMLTPGLEVWDYHGDSVTDAPSALTAGNFKKERDFKLEVLEWLTNGKPKLFRSASEGSYIVRLMNTSLTPNDQLSRMIHNFQCTAYEIADCNFDNLREYGMLMDEKIEIRQELVFKQVDLSAIEPTEVEGQNVYVADGLNAVIATLYGPPHTTFRYLLAGDTEERAITFSITGTYSFDSEVLKQTPLVKVLRNEPWLSNSRLFYGYYEEPEKTEFSNIKSVTFNNAMARWIGDGTNKVPNDIRTSMGVIHFINIQEKTINTDITLSENKFYFGTKPYTPLETEICLINGKYYIGNNINPVDSISTVMTINKGNSIDMDGQQNEVIETSGRIILTNLENINELILGNGIFADVAYQEIIKTYTCEDEEPVKTYKEIWETTQTQENYNKYIEKLKDELIKRSEGAEVNAI